MTDTLYTVPLTLGEETFLPLENEIKLKNHPAYVRSSQKIETYKAEYKAAKADKLPKFNVQGGLQKVNGNNGFYSYQAGISIPLFSGVERNRVQTAKINQQIAETEANFTQQQLKSRYVQTLEAYKKWQSTWQFYKEKSLPLAKEQRQGALFAYKEGAIDYVGFTQMMRDAIQIELEAINALENYLTRMFEIQYFKN